MSVDGQLAEENQLHQRHLNFPLEDAELHPLLKFTNEREAICEIPFLDMKVMRKKNGVNLVDQTNRHCAGLIMN